MGKFVDGAKKAAKSLKPSEVKKDPAKAAGTIVGAGVAAAGHPWIATVAAAGTEKLVNKVGPAVKTRVQSFTEGRGQ
jgi:hypothetical protein